MENNDDIQTEDLRHLDDNTPSCKYCGKQFGRNINKRLHQRMCILNPNKQVTQSKPEVKIGEGGLQPIRIETSIEGASTAHRMSLSSFASI